MKGVIAQGPWFAHSKCYLNARLSLEDYDIMLLRMTCTQRNNILEKQDAPFQMEAQEH